MTARRSEPEIRPAGDRALTVRFGEGLDEGISAAVLDALGALDEGRPAGVVDVAPGTGSLLVVYDPLVLDAAAARAFVAGRLAAAPGAAARRGRRGRRVEIPVLYDPEVAPDLEPLARDKGLTTEEVVALHTAVPYRCHMLGFRPGFPYLGGLPERLAAARLATPRARVPAGSVGIGGRQTGVYPTEGPGGWRLIGRTPLRLFDARRADPCLVHAGDEVSFVAIDRERFAALEGAAP
jgi:inhibitor of KinA